MIPQLLNHIARCISNAASNAIGHAKFFSPSHNAVVGVYDETGNVTETHEHTGHFKE
jgi:hypothetical protein